MAAFKVLIQWFDDCLAKLLSVPLIAPLHVHYEHILLAVSILYIDTNVVIFLIYKCKCHSVRLLQTRTMRGYNSIQLLPKYLTLFRVRNLTKNVLLSLLMLLLEDILPIAIL